MHASRPVLLGAAVLALLLAAWDAGAAEPRRPDPPAGAAGRDLPQGASEAEVRVYCTRRFDRAAADIADMAGGAGGMLTDRLFAEFQACLRRNGIRP